MSIEVLGVNRKIYDVVITKDDLIFLLSEFANIGIDTSTMIVENALLCGIAALPIFLLAIWAGNLFK